MDNCCRKPPFSDFPPNFTKIPGRKYYPNPGTMCNLHRKARDIIPEFFDGIELSFKKGIAANKTIISKWILSHNYPSGFRLGGIYNWSCCGNVLETPVIQAEINPFSLTSNVSVVYYPTKSIKLETKMQNLADENREVLTCESFFSIEYYLGASTITLNAYDPALKSGRSTLSCLRSVSDNFCLGGELLVEWLEDVTKFKAAIAAKYNTDKYAMAATVSREGLDISYWNKINNVLQIGACFAFNKNTFPAIGSICYQWNVDDSRIRGMIDSDWSVGFAYQKLFSQLSCIMGLSLIYNIAKNQFAFGMKLDIDPSLKCPKKCTKKKE